MFFLPSEKKYLFLPLKKSKNDGSKESPRPREEQVFA